MAQILLPDADIETVDWTTTPLWSTLDDLYPGVNDRISSPQNPSGADLEVSLAGGVDPGTDKGHRVRYKIRCSAASTNCDFLVQLRVGTTVIASQTTNHGNTTDTWYAFLLTEAEAANITDYTVSGDLRIRVVATKTAGGNMQAQVADVHLEVPDVNSCDTPIPGGIAASKVRTMIYPNVMGHANNDTPANLQDESGNGHSLVATAAATFKTNVVNGLSAVEFDGVNDQYRMFWPSAAERITYFLIMRHLTLPATGGQAIVSGESDVDLSGKVMLSVDNGQGGLTGDHYVIEQTGASNHEYFGEGVPQTSTFVVHRQRYDSGATGDRGWSDGVELTDGTLPGDAGSNASVGCKLGSREDNQRFWNGQLAFFMVCQGLTDQEELDVEAALLTLLASDEPVVAVQVHRKRRIRVR